MKIIQNFYRNPCQPLLNHYRFASFLRGLMKARLTKSERGGLGAKRPIFQSRAHTRPTAKQTTGLFCAKRRMSCQARPFIILLSSDKIA
jgi:hypothetical protein